MAISRPKVHKLPEAGRAKNRKKNSFPGFFLFFGVALIASMMVSVSMKKEPVVKAATLLPPVAVVSNRISPAPHEETDTSGVLSASIGDAQAAPTAPPVYTVATEGAGATITLKDQSNMIVGQMAKIPLENEQITEVKPINEVDNSGGHALLSIVGKY